MRRRPASESSLRKSSGGWWTTFARYPGSNRSSVAAFLFLGLFYELMTFLFVVAMTIVVTIFILTGATTIVVFVWMMRMRMGLLLMVSIRSGSVLISPVDESVGVGVGGRRFSSVPGSDSDRGRVHVQTVCELHLARLVALRPMYFSSPSKYLQGGPLTNASKLPRRNLGTFCSNQISSAHGWNDFPKLLHVLLHCCCTSLLLHPALLQWVDGS